MSKEMDIGFSYRERKNFYDVTIQKIEKFAPVLQKIRAFLIYDLIITIVFWGSVFLVGEVSTEGFGPIAIWALFIAWPIKILENYIVGPLFALWFQKHDFTAIEILLSSLIIFVLTLLIPVVTLRSALCMAVIYCVVYAICKKVRLISDE